MHFEVIEDPFVALVSGRRDVVIEKRLLGGDLRI